MSFLSTMFKKSPEKLVEKASPEKLEELVKSSEDAKIRRMAAERLDREDIWQYMVLHDRDNRYFSIPKCHDFNFLKNQKISNWSEFNFSILVLEKVKRCESEEELVDLVTKGYSNNISEYNYVGSSWKYKVKNEALNKIINKENLLRVALEGSPEFSKIAIGRIDDPELLIKFILEKNIKEYKARDLIKSALERINDSEHLQYIVEHSTDKDIVAIANLRIKEEKVKQVCHGIHDWETLRKETDDDGDSPRFDYYYKKCKKCGLLRCETYISGVYHNCSDSYTEVVVD